jgi:hypothetical protein
MSALLQGLTANVILRHGGGGYFLAKSSLTAALHYLMALASVLFVIWPKSQFLRVGSPPLTFSIEAMAATLIVAYLSFSYGASRFGDETLQVSPRALVWQGLTRHGAMVSLTLLTVGHTLFFIVLACPVLIAAAHVSGISAANFGQAVALMGVCTLAYRWLGLVTLCVWETQDFTRYVVARVAFVILVIGSAFFFPASNPLLALVSMSFGEELGQVVRLYGNEFSYASVTLIIHLLLLLGAYIMVVKLLKS